MRPRFLATAVGSMPHADPEPALEIVLAHLPEAPIWPQLSGRGLNEQMEIQYSEGMPRRVIDRDKGRMYFDTTGDYSEEFADFYEAYMLAMDPDDGTGDCSAMAITPEYAAGLYALEQKLAARGGKLPYVKCHTTGPCSFALTIVDETKRALYYNDEFRDVVVKALAMKCRWQVQRFKPYAENVICFIDEPILAGFGSSTYVSVKREDVVAILGEVVDAIHADGGIAGMHCCGNTEWSIPIDAGADIVNFDAFEFGETIAMYPQQVKSHLAAGRALAWGVVPTSAAVNEQTLDTLVAHYEKVAQNLADKAGLELARIYDQTVLTGSCGTGSLDPALAARVFELTGALSAALRDKHGG